MAGPMLLLLLLALLARAFAAEYNNLADVSCGRSEPGAKLARIVGGESAAPREFPWLVSITRKGGHICGGTILNAKFVLTAAHCFCYRDGLMPLGQLRITVGEHDLAGREQPDAETLGVAGRAIHPGFACGKYSSDVALLQLSRPALWSEGVQPACLPARPGRTQRDAFAGRSAVTAGWGWLGEDKSLYKKSSILQKVGVNVIEDDVCNEWFASQDKAFRVKYGQMCAGHESGGRDACAADSGGPLMLVDEEGRTLVIGIVSTGIGCARKRLPGVYTRVSEFIPWILENTRS